ncbi:hypothetical protein [Streptomyces sp. NPDC052225]|uniref:hypothetical protein n=1 Tax=Streptomyces sp. NPDC052225 TaxID=3154949 RepID=UPI0034132C0D
MTTRRLTRAAVATALTLLAFGTPAVAQAAVTAAPEPCHRYQATVNRHQNTIDELDARLAPVEARIEAVEHDYQVAEAELEYAHTRYSEARDWVRELESEEGFDPADPDYLKAVADRDHAAKRLEEANAADRAAYEAMTSVERDPQLLADRARAQKLLRTAEKRLATCLAKAAA